MKVAFATFSFNGAIEVSFILELSISYKKIEVLLNFTKINSCNKHFNTCKKRRRQKYIGSVE